MKTSTQTLTKNEVIQIVDEHLLATGKIKDYDELIQHLLIYQVKHDHQVFDHAFELGRIYGQDQEKEATGARD